MNILHLKYAVEISRTHSLSRAADNLYMAQPNLSRAIKELEDTLGITIFERTTRGMKVTPDGEEFLEYAREILKQIDDVEGMYKNGKLRSKSFSACAPRSSYISYAFAQFAGLINRSSPIKLFYKETNSSNTINYILTEEYNLGIIRYASNHDRYFKELLASKGCVHETISEFTFVLVMSKSHPLAAKEEIYYDDLPQYIEIAHADPFVPSLSMATVRREELPDNIDKRIFVFERASQFDLLDMTPGTFMWVSPLPDGLLDKFGLVQRKCKDNTRIYKDVLIYRKNYKLSDYDRLFIAEVSKSKQKYL